MGKTSESKKDKGRQEYLYYNFMFVCSWVVGIRGLLYTISNTLTMQSKIIKELLRREGMRQAEKDREDKFKRVCVDCRNLAAITKFNRCTICSGYQHKYD